MANPDLAAYMPAYKAPIPQPLVDCLEQNPMGCPWADYRQYFDEQVIDHRNCFWPDSCQEDPRWAHLAPRKVTRPEQINEPLGRRRADQLAHVLGKRTLGKAAPTRNQPTGRALAGCYQSASQKIQWTWVVGGGASPTKMMMPSPPGFPPMVSMSKSGFQLLMDQMLPA